MSNLVRSCVLGLCVHFTLGIGMVWAGSGSAGTCDPPDVEVRGKLYLRNNTGQTATDCHFYMYQNDRASVHVNGAKAASSSFGTVGVTLGTDNGQGGTPPPGNHGAQVDLTGGTVAAGETIAIDISLCMNEQNCVKFKDIEWTFTGGSGDPPEPARRGNGFRISRPSPGGGGGAPDTQEGNGGAGRFVHRVCIENDSATDPLPLQWVKLFASMTTYSDLEAIDWAAVPEVQDAAGRPPVTIPPGGSWCFDFPTTGNYVGGHVYIRYGVAALGGVAARAQDDTDDVVVGDHPVEAALDFSLIPGDDYWMTDDVTTITFGNDVPIIPADFFDPGSEPFTGTIQLQGLPLDPSLLGPTDTIVRRLSLADLGEPGSTASIPIEIVALSLRSTEPLEIPSFVSNGLSWLDVIQPYTNSGGLNPVVVGVSNNGVSLDTEAIEVSLSLVDPPLALSELSASDDGGPPGIWGIGAFLDLFLTPEPSAPPLPVDTILDLVVDIRDPGLVDRLAMAAEPYVDNLGTTMQVTWYTETLGGFKEQHVLTLQPAEGQPIIIDNVGIQGLDPGLSIFRVLIYAHIINPTLLNPLAPAIYADLVTEQMFPVESRFFDVLYFLDDTAPATGIMDVTRDDDDGGTFSMFATYTPVIAFEEVGGGPILTLAEVGPRGVNSILDTEYRYAPAPPAAYPNAGPNFWPLPEVVHPLSMPDGIPHLIIPAQSGGAPVPVFAESVKIHGAGGSFGMDLLNPSGILASAVESRMNSVTQVVVTFDKPVSGIGGLDPADVVVSSGSVVSVSQENDYQLTVNLTGVAPGGYTRISFPGVIDSLNQAVTPDSSICFAAKIGDVNADGNLNVFDMVIMRNMLNEPTSIANFRADLNIDNAVNVFDLVVARNNLNQSVVGSCPP